MSDEKIEKQMEFIIEQQAQFASKIGQLEEIVARLATATLSRVEATDRRIDDGDERISALIDAQLRTEAHVDERISALIDAQLRTEAHIEERISALVDAQLRTEAHVTKTDETLRNLIAVVDRYFGSGRDGNP